MRKVIAILEVDDDMAIAEGLGTLDYLGIEFVFLADRGLFLQEARIIDVDDKHDAKAIKLVNQIFEEE